MIPGMAEASMCIGPGGKQRHWRAPPGSCIRTDGDDVTAAVPESSCDTGDVFRREEVPPPGVAPWDARLLPAPSSQVTGLR